MAGKKKKKKKVDKTAAKDFKAKRKGDPRKEADVEVADSTKWLKFRYSEIEGRGAFARKAIPSGTRVIEYLGRRITKEESAKLCEDFNEYIFDLNSDFDLDGNVEWNPARLINHSCEPNCEAEQEDETIWIVATRDIRKGDEVTFNYGYSLENYRDYPCKCGMDECVGYIVAAEFHDLVRRENDLPKKGKKKKKD